MVSNMAFRALALAAMLVAAAAQGASQGVVGQQQAGTSGQDATQQQGGAQQQADTQQQAGAQQGAMAPSGMAGAQQGGALPDARARCLICLRCSDSRNISQLLGSRARWRRPA